MQVSFIFPLKAKGEFERNWVGKKENRAENYEKRKNKEKKDFKVNNIYIYIYIYILFYFIFQIFYNETK